VYIYIPLTCHTKGFSLIWRRAFHKEITGVLDELAGSTLKVEDVVITFFETSLDVYRTKQRDIRQPVTFTHTAVRTWNILYKCDVCAFNWSEFDIHICQRSQSEDLHELVTYVTLLTAGELRVY
jgi:hypothetical protein